MPNYKLGKLPAKKDVRTIKLKSILKTGQLPALPATYDVDVDELNTTIPEQMFGNDQWGDCVIAGRANHTLRGEYYQQKIVLPITTQDCLNEYFKEGGATPGNPQPDNGLNMLDSLNEWRTSGWLTCGRTYNIYAYAAIDAKSHDELKYSVMLLDGGYIGIEFPASAMDQFNNGQPWTVVPGDKIEGGHALYIVGYNDTGPICVTWGQRQQMTWDFYDTYCDESYAIVDNKDDWVANDPLDVGVLSGYLSDISNSPPNPTPQPAPVPQIESIWDKIIAWLESWFKQKK